MGEPEVGEKEGLEKEKEALEPEEVFDHSLEAKGEGSKKEQE